MQFRYKLVFLVVMAILLCGMGGAGNKVVSSIPDPDREFTAKIVDQSDVSYKVHRISVDGLTYLPAAMGEAKVGIDFAKISKIHFYMQGDSELAVVHFVQGGKKRFHLDPETKIHARSKWGNVQLICKNIKTIEFQKD